MLEMENSTLDCILICININTWAEEKRTGLLLNGATSHFLAEST